MSHLNLNFETVKCEGCKEKMLGYFQITFCKARNEGKKIPMELYERCNRVVCPVCEYCSWCQIGINSSIKKIKSLKHNLTDKKSFNAFEKERDHLFFEYGITYKDELPNTNI